MEAGTSTALILCLPPAGRWTGRLQTKAGHRMRFGQGFCVLREADHWAHLERIARAASPLLFLVDPCRGTKSPPTLERVARLHRWSPTVPIIAWTRAHVVPPRSWLALRDLGVADVIGEDEIDDRPELLRRLERFVLGGRGPEALASLESAVSPQFVALLQRAYPRAHRGLKDDGETALTCDVLASLWMRGATARQLRHHFAREGLPPPGWLCRWLITLRATCLRETMQSWETVAPALGFERLKGLRRFTRRLTGSPPSRLTVENVIELLRERDIETSKRETDCGRTGGGV